jgi:hypothetical protein
MWAERIKKGFHRIGVILAALSLLVGSAAFLFGAYQWSHPLVQVPTFEVATPSGKRLVVRYGTEPRVIGVTVKEHYEKTDDQLAAVELIDRTFGRIDLQREEGTYWMLGSLASLVVGALLFASSKAIGWVLAGFFGD